VIDAERITVGKDLSRDASRSSCRAASPSCVAERGGPPETRGTGLRGPIPAAAIRANSLLKSTLVVFFKVAKLPSEALRGSQNNDLRRYFEIASMRFPQGMEYFNALLK
jgi:hypothetical protein